MRNHKQYQMQFATVVSLIALVLIPGAARSADAPSGQRLPKPASDHVGNMKSDGNAAGVRDHLQLQPVASEQFKTAAKPDKKLSAPGVRAHLNLRPLTADDFKNGAKVDRNDVAPPSAAK